MLDLCSFEEKYSYKSIKEKIKEINIEEDIQNRLKKSEEYFK